MAGVQASQIQPTGSPSVSVSHPQLVGSKIYNQGYGQIGINPAYGQVSPVVSVKGNSIMGNQLFAQQMIPQQIPQVFPQAMPQMYNPIVQTTPVAEQI